jgi:hypothetical protein
MKYVDQICITRGGKGTLKSGIRREVWKVYLGGEGEHPYCVTFLGWYSSRDGFISYTGRIPYKRGFRSAEEIKKRVRLASKQEKLTIELAHY